ncbi:histone H2A deubiquitinase MYSM1-like isoform X2 [Condylostylus longicornis]|uniref:histone H2A deubiquitinase MYSM1-like isoform X2 n=1 Tax=Condylostylus longicornis TaxID=2530218 RepID=UPI00244E5776|nr:histone H2A deubiquitinase MYSM1-like isoform X2 [Condylostylus longicornis]
MEDEEEIDIIGDYDDISKITSGQLLSCDYTVHPKWVNENAEGGNFWSDSVPKHDNLENNVEVLHSEEVVIEEPKVSNKKILDLEWIASQNDDVVFEEDIPATTEEVIEDEYCTDKDKECHNELLKETTLQNIYSCNGEWDESVAAFETHPAPKNNKYIGPTNSRSLLKVKIENPLLLSPNPRSLLKINRLNLRTDGKQQSKFKQTLTISRNLFDKVGKAKEFCKETDLNKEKTKFRQSLKIDHTKLRKLKIKKNKNLSAASPKIPDIVCSKKNKEKDKKLDDTIYPKKRVKTRKNLTDTNYGENITINHETELLGNEQLTSKNSTNFSSSTLVKLQNVESDEVIDIEADLSEDEIIDLKRSLFGVTIHTENLTKECSRVVKSQNELNSTTNEKLDEKINVSQAIELVEKLPEKLVFEIQRNMAVPNQELILSASEVTELEKYFNSEFFDGKSSSKTPEQYLRIRNHILTMWNVMGKNGYVSKTSVRSGLKHGGDVNSISRIHRLLEQIGAINFGYQGKYFEYVRPLEQYFAMFIQNKCQYGNSNLLALTNGFTNSRKPRTRTRTNYFALENGIDSICDINYTIEHEEGIYIPKISKVMASESKLRNVRHIKTEQDLVKCLKFSKYNIAPFKVSITLSTLLCIQLHSLSSNFEVMGFLGGHRSKSIGRNKMCLTRYKPCKTIEHSGTMCEMCPISQLEQSRSLKQEGYELLGWYHSHPLFPPDPSRTDVQTQIEMQMQFSAQSDRTFIGLILSCIAMHFKCIYVLPKDYNSNLNGIVSPYELDVDIIKDCTNFKYDILDVFDSINEMNDEDKKHNVFQKFKLSSGPILEQYGYKPETFFNDIL